MPFTKVIDKQTAVYSENEILFSVKKKWVIKS